MPIRATPPPAMSCFMPWLFIEGKKYFEAKPGMDYDTIEKAVRNVFEEARKA